MRRGLSTGAGAELAESFARGRQAQKTWAALSLAERKEPIKRFQALLKERSGELAATLTADMGKPLAFAKGEIAATVPRINFFLDHVDRVVADQVMRSNASQEERLRWEPLGVVGCISAWNYPYFIGSNVYIPALLTGNAVLYKPSEHVATSGQRMAALFDEAGLPGGLFQCLEGSAATGEALLQVPIDGMFFTGSERTGMAIKRALVDRNIPVQLELGGKDAAYVMADLGGIEGDLSLVHKAAESLGEGAMFNSGQGCCSIERIYVHQDIYEPFLAKLQEVVATFVTGDPLDEKTFLGPMCLPHGPNVVHNQIRDAVESGARVLCGGEKLSGKAYAPTILVDATQDMRVMQEESFGPLVCVAPVATDAEAVERMNDSRYGLTAAVYGRDQERATGILAQIKTGTAYFNCCDRVSAHLPWTGQKGSGVGGTMGELGIRAFLRPKAYHYKVIAK